MNKYIKIQTDSAEEGEPLTLHSTDEKENIIIQIANVRLMVNLDNLKQAIAAVEEFNNVEVEYTKRLPESCW